MSETEVDKTDVDLNSLRALVYKYASYLLDYPYEKRVKTLKEQVSDFIELLSLLREKGYEIEFNSSKLFKITEEIEKLGLEEFQAEYVSLFEVGYPKPKCPPFEREYLNSQEKDDLKFLAELVNYYSRYGVVTQKEAPDYLIVELEFMYYLIAKEMETKEQCYKKAQLEFLERMLKWIENFYRCVKRKSRVKGYANILKVFLKFMKKDHEFLLKEVS